MGFFDAIGDVFGTIGDYGWDILTYDPNQAAAEAQLEELRKQKEIARQQAAIAKSEADRQVAISNRERDIEATATSEQSRAGAIQKFQAESTGEAAEGISGLSAGSSPYLALESQISEAGRKIDTWFQSAAEKIDISEIAGGGAREVANLNERTAITNQGILSSRIRQTEKSIARMADDALWNNLLAIGMGALSAGMSIYSIGSGIAAMSLMSGGGDLGSVAKGVAEDPLNLFRLGGAVQYGSATGDTGPLTSLFADGGAFDAAKKTVALGPMSIRGGPSSTMIASLGKVSPLLDIKTSTLVPWSKDLSPIYKSNSLFTLGGF